MQIDYLQMLDSLIPVLEQFEHKSGVEGTAYFVDDKFVVKKITSSCVSDFYERMTPENFNSYALEIANFAHQGFCVPKIYAWKTLPKADKKLYKYSEDIPMYDFYLLEERMPGNHFYLNSVNQIQKDCLDFCDQAMFEEAMLFRSSPLYAEIIKRFLNISIEKQQQLLALNERELEHFYLSHYGMNMQSQFSSLDVHSNNVLFTGDKLSIIDNSFGLGQKCLTETDAKEMLIDDVVSLFQDLICIKTIAQQRAFIDDDEIKKLNNLNNRLTGEAMLKMIQKANSMFAPVYKSEELYFDSLYFIKNNFEKELSDTLLSELQFEK